MSDAALKCRPRILVACEYSGVVRDAFAARGWDAWSCDLLESERSGAQHYVGDVRDMLEQDWDLMVAHPPCTFLSNSGAKHLYVDWTLEQRVHYMEVLGEELTGRSPIPDIERWKNMQEAADFFNLLWNADVPHVAVENPVMHGHGIKRVNGRATQFVQPWMFGHLETKRTGFRLKNLPPLVPSDNVFETFKTLPKSETHKVHRMSPGPDRWKERSRTYQGIGDAMAEQWGAYVEAELTIKKEAA